MVAETAHGARVALEEGQLVDTGKGRRHLPPRVEDEVAERVREDGCGAERLADDAAVDARDPIAFPGLHREARDIDAHVARAEIVRQPAPALHVHAQGLRTLATRTIERCERGRACEGIGFETGIELIGAERIRRCRVERAEWRGGCVAKFGEACLQGLDARARDADPQGRTCGDLCIGACFRAESGEGFAESGVGGLFRCQVGEAPLQHPGCARAHVGLNQIGCAARSCPVRLDVDGVKLAAQHMRACRHPCCACVANPGSKTGQTVFFGVKAIST